MNVLPSDIFNQIISFLAELTKWIYIGLFVIVVLVIIALFIMAIVNISRFAKNRKNEQIK